MSPSTIVQLCRDESYWVEPVLSKDKCVLLKDTTQWRRWGSNQRPLGLESSTSPLSHCAPFIIMLKSKKVIYKGISKLLELPFLMYEEM